MVGMFDVSNCDPDCSCDGGPIACCDGFYPNYIGILIHDIPEQFCSYQNGAVFCHINCADLNGEYYLYPVKGNPCCYEWLEVGGLPLYDEGNHALPCTGGTLASLDVLFKLCFVIIDGIRYIEFSASFSDLSVFGGRRIVLNTRTQVGVDCCGILNFTIELLGDQIPFTVDCCTSVSAASEVEIIDVNCEDCCLVETPTSITFTISGVTSGTSTITLGGETCTIECSQLNREYTALKVANCNWGLDVTFDITGCTPTTYTFHFVMYTITEVGVRYLYFMIWTDNNFVQYLARKAITTLPCCDFASLIIELLTDKLSSSFCTPKFTTSSELLINSVVC